MIKNYYSLRKLGKPYGLTCSKMAGIGLCSLLLCASPQAALADVSHADAVEAIQQTTKIKGTVVDNTGFGVIGAAVVVKGTTNGVVTDFDGNFEIEAKVGDMLEISYVGYKTITIAATAQHMNLTMEEDTETLDEVVVVGYTSTSKRDLIASVSTVKAEQISNMPVANVAQGLAGRSPGLIVKASGGGINSKPSISIRGGGEPIYVIDGIIRSGADFANLSPDDIQSMSILKDASATAVYGSRATNGIIQIVTKQGQAGKISFEYDFNQSFAQPSIWPEKMSSYDRAIYANIARENDGLDPAYTQEGLNHFKNGTDPLNFANTNWRKLVLNDWAPMQKHSIRLTGGSETNQYYVSLGHIDQNSLYKNDNHWMKRTNFRVSNSTLIKALGLRINTTIDGYRQHQTHPYTSTASDYYGVFSHINDKYSRYPGVNKFGLPYNITDNPVAETAKDAGYIRNIENVINGKGELIWEVPWVAGLKVRAASNYRYYGETQKSWRKDAAQYDWDSESPIYANKPVLNHTSATGYSFTNQAFVEYAGQFGKHSVSALGGFEQYYEKTESYWLQRDNYAFDIDQIGVGDANSQTNGGSEAEMGRAAWIGQVKYNYDNKYYAEGSIRYDGSDRFAPGKRWGFFPAVSLGWRISEEDFLYGSDEWLENLKLRLSAGEVGVDNVSPYGFLNQYGQGSPVYLGGTRYNTLAVTSIANLNLTWARTRSFNAGLDASFWGGLFGFEFDVFYTHTYDMLTYMGGAYPPSMGGYYPVYENFGEQDSRGMELVLTHNNKIGEGKNALHYNVALNLTYAYSRWIKYTDKADTPDYQCYAGQELGAMLGWVADGLYQSEEDIDNSPWPWQQRPRVGDIKYVDLSGNGIVDYEDKAFTGRSNRPKFTAGLNISMSWRNFDFSTLITGAALFDISLTGTYYNGNDDNTIFTETFKEGGSSPVSLVENAWRPDNQNGTYPRLTVDAPTNNNGLASTFWFRDGKYLRMKSLQFGYTLPEKACERLGISNLRVYVEGANLFTLSGLPEGIDPESPGVNNGYYPQQKTFMGGVSITF